MTKANECTCPSGDGSLRHPCPAHPASVELAGVAAKLTFINGRPAMCGCQVEYSSGGGEYSDVIYVTLCAKHSGSAILDLVATNRIALTPEYEGQWHADLYLDREIPLAKAEGATPAEAVLALMSAERIDPEQESVEQAGGDERVKCAVCVDSGKVYDISGEGPWKCYACTGSHEVIGYANGDELDNMLDDRAAVLSPVKTSFHTVPVYREARAALAQPSPTQAEQTEVEVVARVMHSNPVVLDHCGPLNANDELMTVAQHAASVARWAEMFNRVEQERDAALSRVAELEKQEPVAHLRASDLERLNQPGIAGSAGSLWNGPREGFVPLYAAPVAQAQQLHDLDKQCRDDVARALGLRPSQDRGFAWSYLLASIKSCAKASEDAAQAQHSVPEGWMLVPVERLLNMMSDKDHDTRIMAERQLLAVLAALPGKEGV
ncbi:hypothetical protein [Pseudomonas aeruginosa]|uniref:hypothetical protein n=1 Tax=Pseudomonas aeruginosa TaxID=287 RepID=UPI002A6B0C9E|nr:hypothetical protein [Pseudomonas aeruginosa]MDY1511942.1 hypothetical protein [Pseudomonas aeruginosa]